MIQNYYIKKTFYTKGMFTFFFHARYPNTSPYVKVVKQLHQKIDSNDNTKTTMQSNLETSNTFL